MGLGSGTFDSDETFLRTRGPVHGRIRAGGQPRAKTRRAYPCPTCQAKAGQACRRWSGGRVKGVDIGGGYWHPMKSMHPARQVQRTA